nr:MAG TPA: hypothetical protein [Caudoviricetes sp.]
MFFSDRPNSFSYRFQYCSSFLNMKYTIIMLVGQQENLKII